VEKGAREKTQTSEFRDIDQRDRSTKGKGDRGLEESRKKESWGGGFLET